MKTQETTQEWVTTSVIREKLGVSNDYLYKLIPLLEKGKHYRNISFSKFRATYRWHLKRLEKLIDSRK